MKMIAHQAVVVQPEAEALAVPLDEAEESGAILVVGEDLLAVVAPVHQVEAGFARPLVAARDRWHRGVLLRLPDTPARRPGCDFILNARHGKVLRRASPFAIGTPGSLQPSAVGAAP